MKIFGHLFCTNCPAATRGLHAQVGNPQRALHRTLRDRDVLDVCKVDSHLADRCNSFANAQAAIRDHVPPLFKIQTQHGESEKIANDKQPDNQRRDEKQHASPAFAFFGQVENKNHARNHNGYEHDKQCKSGFETPEKKQVAVIVWRGAKYPRAGFVAGRWLWVVRDAQEPLGDLAEGAIHEGDCQVPGVEAEWQIGIPTAPAFASTRRECRTAMLLRPFRLAVVRPEKVLRGGQELSEPIPRSVQQPLHASDNLSCVYRGNREWLRIL